MARNPLSRVEYDKIKAELELGVRGLVLGKKYGRSRPIITNIKRTKDFEEYREKYQKKTAALESEELERLQDKLGKITEQEVQKEENLYYLDKGVQICVSLTVEDLKTAKGGLLLKIRKKLLGENE